MRANNRKRREPICSADASAGTVAVPNRRGRTKLGSKHPSRVQMHGGESCTGIQSNDWTIPEDQPELILV
jgi:hypothetical protein